VARVREAARRAASIRPVYVLVPLVLAQWAATAAVGLRATHNGWLFYHGGDGTYYWTTAWSLAHHHLPETVISYGLPVALWPLGLVFGANMLAGLPGVIAFQVLVLAPVGVIAMFALAARIGGRLFGYLATVVWILMPLLALWNFNRAGSSYRPKLHDLVLPNALGLTTLADYTSMILALVATFFLVRALDERRWNDVVLAGLTAGTLIAVKPSNTYYLVAPLLAFAVCRRWREGLAFLACLVPVVITLAVWKRIGLGYVPLISSRGVALAYAGGVIPSAPSSWHRYYPFDWATLTTNMGSLHEESQWFWVLEWLTVGGLIGLIRRAPVPGLAVGAWFCSYLFFKGGAEGLASVDSTSFFRLVMPAFPAFTLICVSVVFLVPGIPRRRLAPAVPAQPTRLALVAVLALAVYPLLLVATAQAWPPGRVVKQDADNLLVPVSSSLAAHVFVQPDAVHLWWQPDGNPSHVAYEIFRSGGVGCTERTSGARDCVLDPASAGITRSSQYVDRWPPAGVLTYRIGLLAGPAEGDPGSSDLILVGPPVRVRFGGPS
jgi:hypothetical protein